MDEEEFEKWCDENGFLTDEDRSYEFSETVDDWPTVASFGDFEGADCLGDRTNYRVVKMLPRRDSDGDPLFVMCYTRFLGERDEYRLVRPVEVVSTEWVEVDQ